MTMLGYIALGQQDLLVNNVLCLQLVAGLCWIPHNGKLQLAGSTDSGTGHIELSMAKHLAPKPDSHILQGLPLWLVDCGGKGDPDWELSPLPLKWVVTCLRDECDAGNENNSIWSLQSCTEAACCQWSCHRSVSFHYTIPALGWCFSLDS